MPHFTLTNGQTFTLNSFTGVVVSKQSSFSTEVFESNGRVNVETSNQEKVWLKAANGAEHEAHIGRFNVGSRAGHEMTVVWGAPQGRATGIHLGVMNRTSGKRSGAFDVYYPDWRQVGWKWAGMGGGWGYFATLVALGIPIGGALNVAFGDSFVGGALLGALLYAPMFYAGTFLFWRIRPAKRLTSELQAHIDRLLNGTTPAGEHVQR